MIRNGANAVIKGFRSLQTLSASSPVAAATPILNKQLSQPNQQETCTANNFFYQSSPRRSEQKENYGPDCIQFDFSKVDTEKVESDLQIENMSDIIKTDVESMKPHIVYVQHLQEGLYNVRLKMMLQRLGYDSLFQPSHGGRGQATFIRNDKVIGNDDVACKAAIPD